MWCLVSLYADLLKVAFMLKMLFLCRSTVNCLFVYWLKVINRLTLDNTFMFMLRSKHKAKAD